MENHGNVKRRKYAHAKFPSWQTRIATIVEALCQKSERELKTVIFYELAYRTVYDVVVAERIYNSDSPNSVFDFVTTTIKKTGCRIHPELCDAATRAVRIKMFTHIFSYPLRLYKTRVYISDDEANETKWKCEREAAILGAWETALVYAMNVRERITWSLLCLSKAGGGVLCNDNIYDIVNCLKRLEND